MFFSQQAFVLITCSPIMTRPS